MNKEPEQFERVRPEVLERFVSSLAQKAGMPERKAGFLARLLVGNDLRGTFSHGSQQIARYAQLMRDGTINPDPNVRISRDSGATIVVDGDGGLGYFAAYEAAEALVEKCRGSGIAAAVTKNHGHIGAAGIYSRLLADNGLIGYVTSGHQLSLKPEASIMSAAGGSPMSFAVPCGEEPPMVLDFGTMHDLYESSPHVPELFRLAPGLVFRSMGLGFMCQALGGFLAGVPVEESRASFEYSGAYQGSLIIALSIEPFLSPESFKSEMDAYMRLTSQMKPMPGFEKATLPGVLEVQREKEWRTAGIPIGENVRRTLADAAEQFGLELPF